MTETDELWEAYLDAERRGLRDLALSNLERFVDRLLEEPRGEVREWAWRTIREATDAADHPRVRMPLFRRVLLPVLIEGVLGGDGQSARYLAKFAQMMHAADLSSLPESLRHPMGLLDEALRLDPTDLEARKALVQAQASYLRYTIHDVPIGVLDGPDGATIEQCRELQSFLRGFKEHVSVLGLNAEFQDLIVTCDYHFQAYQLYLHDHEAYGSYRAYLEQHGGV